jgi:hypothetical protein
MRISFFIVGAVAASHSSIHGNDSEKKRWYGYDDSERPSHWKDNTKREYDRAWPEVEEEIRDEYNDEVDWKYVKAQVDDAKRRWIQRQKKIEERKRPDSPVYEEDYNRGSDDPRHSY